MEFKRVCRKVVRCRGASLGALLLLAMVVLSIMAPVLTSHDPLEMDPINRLRSPDSEHPLGTDQYGRDLWSRVLYGGRVSLLVGGVAVVLSAALGVPVGLLAGYFGGRTDMVLMRIIDVLLAFPGILLALVILTFLGGSMTNLSLALGIAGMPRFARLVRGCVLSIRELEFVSAATACGATDTRVMVRHVLFNIVPTIVIFASLTVGGKILDAAALGFLGLGVQPPTPEWGLMLSEARNYMRVVPRLAIMPGMAIFLTVLCFNLVGDGLRDVLDPKLR